MVKVADEKAKVFYPYEGLNRKLFGIRSKVSIKVINHYNKDCESDYTIIDLKELVDDKKILEKVLNTETVDFEYV